MFPHRFDSFFRSCSRQKKALNTHKILKYPKSKTSIKPSKVHSPQGERRPMHSCLRSTRLLPLASPIDQCTFNRSLHWTQACWAPSMPHIGKLIAHLTWPSRQGETFHLLDLHHFPRAGQTKRMCLKLIIQKKSASRQSQEPCMCLPVLMNAASKVLKTTIWKTHLITRTLTPSWSQRRASSISWGWIRNQRSKNKPWALSIPNLTQIMKMITWFLSPKSMPTNCRWIQPNTGRENPTRTKKQGL